MHARGSLPLVLLALLPIACANTLVPLATYTQLGGTDASAFAPFRVGQKLAIGAGLGACPVRVAPSQAALAATASLSTVRETFGAGTPVALTVRDIVVSVAEADEDRWIGVAVAAADGKVSWLRVPTQQPIGCVKAWSDQLDQAMALIGKELTFAPSIPTCRELVLAGGGVGTAFIDTDTVPSFTVSAVHVGGPGLSSLREPGSTPWVALGSNDLYARSDVARTCFTTGGEPAGKTQGLRLTEGTCKALGESDPSLECRAMVGTWEGEIGERGAHLRFAHRNLGPVRVTNGKPVTGVRFASMLVSVTTGRAGNARIAKLYDAVRGLLGELAQRTIDDVAIVVGEVASAKVRVQVDLSRLSVAAPTQRPQNATSEFIARHEDQPNPDYFAAETAVRGAEAEASKAQANYDAGLKAYELSKQQCEAAANSASQLSNNVWVDLLISAGNVGCQVAASPGVDEIAKAQGELATAKMKLAGTPRTKRVPITEVWNYTKTVHSREATATLELAVQRDGDPTPRRETLPIRFVWEDYEVAADAPHNVQAHAVDRRPLVDTDALLPGLGREVATSLQRLLDGMLAESVMAAAQSALEATGQATQESDDQRVDAAAFAAVRERLVTNLKRGRSQLASSPIVLPTTAAGLEPNQCLLLVAVPEGNEGTRLSLRTSDGFWVDDRGTAPAHVELCPSDGATLPRDAKLTASAPGWVRWGLYVTKRWSATP